MTTIVCEDACFTAPNCPLLDIVKRYADDARGCSHWRDPKSCSCGWSETWARIWMPSVATDVDAMRDEPEAADGQQALELGATA